MALNWTMLDASNAPVPLPNEMTITTIDNGVDLSLTIPNSPPSGSATAGGSGGSKKLSETGGRIWLTDQRLIFTTLKPSTSAPLSSLSIPLPSILSTNFHQPTFGANYLALTFKPSPGGGLEGTQDPSTIVATGASSSGSSAAPTAGEAGDISAEIRFKDRGMFEFVSLLEKTRERAIYMKRQKREEEEGEGLPVYTTPFEPSTESTSVLAAPGTRAESGTRTPLDGPPGYAA